MGYRGLCVTVRSAKQRFYERASIKAQSAHILTDSEGDACPGGPLVVGIEPAVASESVTAAVGAGPPVVSSFANED